MNEMFVGIDLGGTNIKIGLFDSKLKLVHKTSVTTEADMGPEVAIDKMAQTVGELLAEADLSLQDVVAVGIGTPGPARYSEGVIIKSTNMPKFKNVPICQMLNDRLGTPIVFDNDANVACWGEYAVGAGKGVKDMVFFTLGTGIGGGIISSGELVHGCDENGAELGHMIIYPDGRLQLRAKGLRGGVCIRRFDGKEGCRVLADRPESSLKKVLDEKGQITSKDVYEHLAAGDKLAKEITDGTAKALAITCINMLHTTEPQRIVFAGGGMIAAGEVLLNRIKDFFNEHIWTIKKEAVEICFATLGEDAGIIGAAALVKHTKSRA